MIAKYVVLAWFGLNALLTISGVGKQRPATKPGAAAIAVAIYAGLITLVALTWV